MPHTGQRQACTDRLWDAYRGDPSDANRNALIERYLYVVQRQAKLVNAKTPSSVELGDLVHYGVFGLIDAIQSYDHSRGVKFQTYCIPRVRGAMNDGLRDEDWVPRLTRSRHDSARRAVDRFRAERGREPDEAELREAMGLSQQDYTNWRGDLSITAQRSLSVKHHETDTGRGVLQSHVLQDPRSDDPVEAAVAPEVVAFVLSGLTGTERAVLYYYYLQGLSMERTGRVLRISLSRAAQVHNKVLDRVGRYFQGRTRSFKTNDNRTRRRAYLRSLPRSLQQPANA